MHMNVWEHIRPHLSRFVRFMRISYLETKSDYQGTYLGLLWEPLSTLIFTAMLTFVFRYSDETSHVDFFLYVLSGYVLWGFISDSISGSTDIIQRRLEFALHNNLTLGGLFGKILIDRLFIYLINIIALIASTILLNPNNLGINVFMFIPFVILTSFTSLSVSYLVNLVTIFFQDMSNFIKTGIRFLFFASPVFWVADNGANSVRRLLVEYNPAAYYLDLSRQVFGIQALNGHIWLVATAMSLVLCVAGLVAYQWSASFVRNIK